MTKDEFMEQYGRIVVTFTEYYKYSFHYKGITLDGNEITISVGGDASEIYRLGVSNNESLPIFVLDPYSGCVRGENREIIEEFFDYD